MDKSVYRGYIDIPCSAVYFSRKMYNIYNVSNVLEQVPIDHTGYPKWDITLTLLFAWIVAYLCICKGIKTSGKVSIECVNHRLFINQNACLCVIFVCVLFFLHPILKNGECSVRSRLLNHPALFIINEIAFHFKRISWSD